MAIVVNDKKKFVDFLSGSLMSGTESLNDVILDFAEDGLHIEGMSAANVSMVKSEMLNGFFSEYEPVGKIPIGSALELAKMIKSKLSDGFSIIRKDNELVFKDKGKKFSASMLSDEHIDPESRIYLGIKHEMPKINNLESIDIDASKLSEFLDDCKSALGDVTDKTGAKVTIETVEGGVKFYSSGKYKFENFYEKSGIREGIKVSFALPFFNCIENLKGNLQLEVYTGKPAIIKCIDKYTMITILTAPLGDE